MLYEDKFIAVCVKEAGTDSEAEMPELLKESTGAENIFCVHRLDRAVGGVMVYAKTSAAAGRLSAAIAGRELRKEYLAVTEGEAPERGVMRDLLFHDSRKNKTYVVDRVRRGVKEAALDFRRLSFADGLSLVYITLHTGRSHQIRVQFASRKLPLVGDGRYGAVRRGNAPALWSYSLSFPHPVSGKTLSFKKAPPCTAPWDGFDIVL